MLQCEQHGCKFFIVKCSIRVFTTYMRIDLFDFMYAFQCILNTISESIKPFNTVQCNLCAPFVLLECINLILAHYAGIIYLAAYSFMFKLSWHI